MSWREAKAHYDSEEHSDEESYCGKMDPAQVKALVDSALALQERRLGEQFNDQLSVLKGQLDTMKIKVPQVEVYNRIKIDPSIKCEVKLDIIKSVPDFDGAHDEYVAWQSALDGYEIFKPYAGSEAHCQAVAIIRNKVKGAARALLVSHNTTLNFDAIIARLDCTYADKTSLRSLKQGLEMVRQEDLSLMTYYDEVERKLTLVTN